MSQGVIHEIVPEGTARALLLVVVGLGFELAALLDWVTVEPAWVPWLIGCGVGLLLIGFRWVSAAPDVYHVGSRGGRDQYHLGPDGARRFAVLFGGGWAAVTLPALAHFWPDLSAGRWQGDTWVAGLPLVGVVAAGLLWRNAARFPRKPPSRPSLPERMEALRRNSKVQDTETGLDPVKRWDLARKLAAARPLVWLLLAIPALLPVAFVVAFFGVEGFRAGGLAPWIALAFVVPGLVAFVKGISVFNRILAKMSR
ncbi:MAG TPA: hypothetical protein ENI90_04380 [Methylothermaceae bacterium]|nr:hypothetical protein [Methylothermaceae bacterium]